MASFFQQWVANFMARRVIAIWVAMSAFAVLAGPFGTFQVFSFAQRLVFWPTTFAVALVLAAGLRAYFQGFLGIERFLAQALLIASLLTLMFTPPLFVAVHWFAGGKASEMQGFGAMALFVFGASLAISVIRHALGDTGAPVAVAAPPERAPRIYARLPGPLRAPLVRLSVRDHYVEVSTLAGTTSLLIRFGDAIEETGGVHGARVHRSHWVAADAIEGAETAAGKFELRLADGSRVPVSKTYRTAAQAMLDAQGARRAKPA